MINQELADNAIKRLTELTNIPDVEMTHEEADQVLCDLLAKLGYQSVVQAFDEVEKYYA